MGSYSPRFRRQDSIGLFFTSPYVSMEMVGKVLFNKMKIESRKIIGVQNISKDKVVVKFNCSDTFKDVLRNFEDKVLQVSEIDSVKLINISSQITYVSACNSPFEMDDEIIIGM